ncbi:hypothetical protein NT6N_22070 [Oceaniferula spumae]|uniref:TerB family tellurite resistance protein n=1 Tax=Oceaniferula spumae TaxID=2979115 RepID=A0AAT9FMH4_9BACT
MGVEIELSGAGFDKNKWRRELGNFMFVENEWKMSPLTLMTLDMEDPDLILFDDEEDRAPTEDASVWVHPAGGIRGVTVKNHDQGIVLSMPTGTGKRDWELATAMAEAGVECGAQVQVDHQAVPAGKLDFSQAEQELWSMFVTGFSKTAEESDNGVITLPVLYGFLHIDLSKDDLQAPDLHDQLVEKMKRYTEAHWASNMVMEKPDGQQLTINIAGGVPTIISMEADGIVLLDQPESPSADTQPLFNGEPIAPEKFIEVMSDHVEMLGPHCYVPLFKYSEHPEIMKALDPSAPKVTSSGMPMPTAVSGQSSSAGINQPPPLKKSLAKGPILVFLLIAAADGDVDEKEIRTFQTMLAVSELGRTPLIKTMLTEARDNFQSLFVDMFSEGKAPTLQMVEFLQVLDGYPEAESKPVRQALYAIGYEIANASGGFLGFGSKISKEEKAALEGLRTMLGLGTDEI